MKLKLIPFCPRKKKTLCKDCIQLALGVSPNTITLFTCSSIKTEIAFESVFQGHGFVLMCTKLFRWNWAPLHALQVRWAVLRNFSKCSLNPAEHRAFYDSPHCQKPQRLSTLLNSEVQECFEPKANKQMCPIIFHNIWHSLHHLLYTNYRP